MISWKVIFAMEHQNHSSPSLECSLSKSGGSHAVQSAFPKVVYASRPHFRASQVFCFFFLILIIYLAVPGLNCDLQDLFLWQMGFPGGSGGKESACDAGGLGLISGSGRSPGGGCSSPLQYSCLKNPMDRRAWRATVHGVTKSWIWPSD